MPGAGTDKTKRWSVEPAPIVVLVEPQMGENIGAAARAMANFGLSRLRLVKPVQGWPNDKARVMAAGADRVLEAATLHDSLADAIGDCSFVVATTARNHDQAKPVIDAAQAAAEMAPRIAAGENVALVFGRERNGLENHEVARADRILTLPVNPAFASLNLAQAVVIVGYEWFKLAGSDLPFATPERSPPVAKQQLDAFFADLERELDKVEFFRPDEKRGVMSVNLRNIFQRIAPSQQDIRTLARRGHGARARPQRAGARRRARQRGRRAPARTAGRAWRGPRAVRSARRCAGCRGCCGAIRPTPNARCGRRCSTTAVSPAAAIKRQVPVGPHIADFVSFPLKCVIALTPQAENEAAAQTRAERRAWLEAHDYRVIEVKAADVERDVGQVLDALAGSAL